MMRLRGGVAKSAEHAPVSWLRPHMSKQWKQWNAQKSEAQNANVFLHFTTDYILYNWVCDE